MAGLFAVRPFLGRHGAGSPYSTSSGQPIYCQTSSSEYWGLWDLDTLAVLKSTAFGSQVAEEEVQFLENYFVQTEQWNRIAGGQVDIVRGEKGAGKSAIYLLLGKNSDMLFDRRILTTAGENPRGTTVFKDLISDPPASEPEFVILWKVYLLTIVAHQLREFGITGGEVDKVYGALEEQGLLERKLNLSGLLRLAQSFARRILTANKLEAGVEFDAATGVPTGVIGRISLQEPTGELRGHGVISLDGLFAAINDKLVEANYSIWVLLDRLDVAFAESHELEANALRALVRVYSDLRALDRIELKIFIREDIWKRITEKGLREASHITRVEVMRWTPEMLRNLILRRILSNETLVKEFGIDPIDVMQDSEKQDAVFRMIFPDQVEQGSRKATTFDWMVTRCADGTGNTAPRELIHLLNSLRDEEIRRREHGGAAPPNGQLFDRSVFKLALPAVSDQRLNTYLFAEYPAERVFLEKLDGEKAEQNPESLATIWGMTREAAIEKANTLVGLGFFQARGSRQEPTYWVPFLYRDALHLVQGKAEAEED